MPNDEIKALRTDVLTLTHQAKSLYADMETRLKAGETVGDDQIKLDALLTAGKEKKTRLQTLTDLDELGSVGVAAADRAIVPAGGMRGATQSLGQLFIDSPQFRHRDTAAETVGQAPRIQPVAVGGIKALYTSGLQTKDIYTTTTTQPVGTLAPPSYDPEIIDIARQRPPSLIDLVPHRQTNAPAVFYVLYSTRTNAAAVVPEYSAGAFGLKPKSDMTFDLKEALVKTIPTYVLASRQILDDAPALAAEINNDLGYEVRVVLEDQIIAGDGTGNNFTGILNTAGIQTRVEGASPSGRGETSADTRADTMRRAITDLQLAFYNPTGFVLNPADAEALELLKDSQGRYLQVWDPVLNRVWRVPTIITAAEPIGLGLLGNFDIGCKLWDRMATTIRIGEPGDLFLRNAVAILAELRAAFAVTRPLAFEKITF